jgi:two-component system sensor histidine kinase CpxA
VLVGELPVARFGPWEADFDVQALRFLAVLLVAGLVGWGLGRHLTQPIVILREATRRMAAGDLSARPGASLRRRRDELADLSRDFDGMAERIETLMAKQNRLVQAQRRLLGDVSHELRSPLARLGVALELARDCIPQTSTTSLPANSNGHSDGHAASVSTLDDALNYIEHEAARLSEIIDRLLTLARLESGVQEMERTPVDLTTLVHAVVAGADFEARSKRRSVIITHCDDCTIVGTPELLRSAIENVLRNAVRYTREDTAVEVALKIERSSHLDGAAPSSRKEASFASIVVRDYGPGVPEDQLEDVFRPFYRVAGARDRKSGGDGLGLAITARAVRLHDGEVSAANAPDEGLVVTIRLSLNVPEKLTGNTASQIHPVR